MKTFAGVAEALATFGADGDTTALYPSSADDTKLFSLLHPALLSRRGIPMPSPDVYVFVDRECPRNGASASLAFEDAQTKIATTFIEPVLVASHPSWLLRVELESVVACERRVNHVLRVRAENDDVYRICAADGWVPDLFVAVDDGCCGYGGNRGCENSLVMDASPLRYLARPPRWWVSDHLGPSHPGSYRPGEVLVPSDAEFPITFRKLALLSTSWGHDWRPFCGATAFAAEARSRASVHVPRDKGAERS